MVNLNIDFVDLLKFLFPYGITFVGAFLFFWICLLFFPEKFEKALSIIWGWLENLGNLITIANKEKIRHSIQSNVINFSRKLSSELPQYQPPLIKIEMVDKDYDKKAFMEQGKAVIRLRKNDQNNENIVTACLVFVSQILLRKSVRYLLPSQREAIELFTGYKMLEHEAPEVYDTFIDKWLFPGIELKNKKISEYFEEFKLIDQCEFFIPIFVQELIYLGEKVYGKRRESSISEEVDGAINFLSAYSLKKIGEKIDKPYFGGNACRFGIMIVGMHLKVEEERLDVYLNHIDERLIPCGVETIYIIGPKKYEAFVNDIVFHEKVNFDNPFNKNYEVRILDNKGNRISVQNNLAVLRRRNLEKYISD